MATRRNEVVLALTIVAGAVLAGCQDPGVQWQAGDGPQAPPIEALGWINGPAPPPVNSAGDVIVVDCFFTT
jgi:hypothetical protein